MLGRGRGLINPGDALKRPGTPVITENPTIEIENNVDSQEMTVKGLVERISAVTSPDDLVLQFLANEIETLVLDESSLSDLVNQLFTKGLDQRDLTPVIGAVCGLAAKHQINQTKLKSLLLTKLENIYQKREELAANDRKQFVTLTMFLGEIFFHLRCSNGSHIKVLSSPVVTCLQMVLKPHLTADSDPDTDIEAMAVAKQLLQNGAALYNFHPNELENVVKGVTEVLIRHKLSDSCRLNLLAALSELWPIINKSLNARTTHAMLAAKLGLTLQI